METEVLKTYFNGALTQDQLIGIIVAVVVVLLILKFVKKTLKLVLTVGVLIAGALYLGLISPTQLNEATDVIKNKGTEVFETIASASDYVQVVGNSDGSASINVKFGDEWVDINLINSFIKNDDGSYTILVGENSYNVTDEGVKQVIDLLSK